MIIKSIRIRNFHCFKDETFVFSRNTTVLIGKNGSGKSSLVKAIKNALSVFFSNNTTWGYSSLAGAVSDLSTSNVTVREVWHDEKMRPADYIDLEVTAEFDGTDLPVWSFHKNAKAKANLQSSFYREAYIEFCKRYQSNGALPLFAYYSDSFPHIEVKLGSSIKSMIDTDEILDRSWGYYHWDYDTSCATIWQLRFMRIYRLHSYYLQALEEIEDKSSASAVNLAKGVEKFAEEINYVKNLLRRFSDNNNTMLSGRPEDLEVNNVIVDGIDTPYIVLLFADGSRRRWDELPAGYARLFNIVLDLAYRSYVLNGACITTQGIVFIDELDLHLHPSMEQDVLCRMRYAFPALQFIVTTHSPLVIGNFKQDNNNTIIQMEYMDAQYEHHFVEDIFGMDYDVTLSSIMGTEPRNVHLQMLKDKYLRLMRRNKEEQAKEVLNKLSSSVSEEAFNKIKKELSERLK